MFCMFCICCMLCIRRVESGWCRGGGGGGGGGSLIHHSLFGFVGREVPAVTDCVQTDALHIALRPARAQRTHRGRGRRRGDSRASRSGGALELSFGDRFGCEIGGGRKPLRHFCRVTTEPKQPVVTAPTVNGSAIRHVKAQHTLCVANTHSQSKSAQHFVRVKLEVALVPVERGLSVLMRRTSALTAFGLPYINTPSATQSVGTCA